jgi:thymidylate synthase (FAD)
MISAKIWGTPQGADAHGEDLCVANAARASFGKRKDELDAKDERLIGYLSDHEHTTPFRHNFVRFECRAPIFVARQLAKHQVGMAWSETSLRYVRAGDVWAPEVWREQSEDKKQGSGGPVSPNSQIAAMRLYKDAVDEAVATYDTLLQLGVCREQARAVLPTGVYTEWKWSGTLQAWAHMCRLRCAPDAQAETRELAEQVRAELVRIWPVAMAALERTA